MVESSNSSSNSLSASSMSAMGQATFKYKPGDTREKIKPRKKSSKRDQMLTTKFAGTTMFKKQRTKKAPFYEPVVLTKAYPKLKNLKVFDCNLEEQQLHEETL